MSGLPYSVLLVEIDGVIEQDEEHPRIALEMRPLGTALPFDQRRRELRVRIGASETLLGEDGIAALAEFLKLKPWDVMG